MKENDFTQMDLKRLFQLKNTWTGQANLAEENGAIAHAEYLRGKVKLIDRQIKLRQQENLNDLFN